ncbi:MAG TPA: BolA family protein [Nitrospiria bacterium]|jgi:stress-induced morphogen
MITEDSLAAYIKKAIPDANVYIADKTGVMDHFLIQVVSDVFKGKNMLDCHRLVYGALKEPMQDGRVHAVEIKTQTRSGE